MSSKAPADSPLVHFWSVSPPVSAVCRCLRIRHSQAQRPTFCALSWRALQPARCCALLATSLPMRRMAWIRPRTSSHLPPLTWPPLLPGPTATPTSRSKVGAAKLPAFAAAPAAAAKGRRYRPTIQLQAHLIQLQQQSHGWGRGGEGNELPTSSSPVGLPSKTLI